jgi:hypothetical protein
MVSTTRRCVPALELSPKRNRLLNWLTENNVPPMEKNPPREALMSATAALLRGRAMISLGSPTVLSVYVP